MSAQSPSTTAPASRDVSCHIELGVTEVADLVFSVAVSSHVQPSEELLNITVAGEPVEPLEVEASNGTRLHRIAQCPVGDLVLDYTATVPVGGPAPAATDHDEILYSRPSRYCDSDRLAALATTHFGQLTGEELVNGVRNWILTNITYAPGSSGPVDGALEAYLRRMGVCRDSAQLAITFLRARNLPARLVSAYAPGLVPMDFHAVAEVLLDGTWYVIDGTGLAPRTGMVRIATGRDAADTAFLSVNSGRASLRSVQVGAVMDPQLPTDDGVTLTQLA